MHGSDDSSPEDSTTATSPDSNFTQFALSKSVLKAIEAVGYEAPYPIQVASIPALLEGRDLVGQAQTGTGKTAAFALPILSRIDLNKKLPQALVLTPTRELAIQVAEAMQTYARQMVGFHVLPIYGGQHIEPQLRQLQRGVHVVIGTPGRLLDHLRRKTLQLDALQTVVLDEADEMLRMGFIDDVEEILKHTPAEKQVALFSATFPAAVRRIADRYLRTPVEVKIESKTTTVAATTQRYWQVSGTHKLDALTRLLEVEDFDAMLVFVRTRTATEELAQKLEARGFDAAALSGEMTQGQRERTIERLRGGKLDIVVATDVAARGLDVDRISHVINFDIPFDIEAYVHRIGRTGRAGRKGDAIMFVAPRERRMLEAIQRATGQRIQRIQLPSREDITDKRVARFKERLSETIESQDLTFFDDVLAGYQRDHSVDMSQIAAALAYLVQHERPLQPPPEAVRDVRPTPSMRPERTERPGQGARMRSAKHGAGQAPQPSRSPRDRSTSFGDRDHSMREQQPERSKPVFGRDTPFGDRPVRDRDRPARDRDGHTPSVRPTRPNFDADASPRSRPARPSFDDDAAPRSRPARPNFDDDAAPRSRPARPSFDADAAPRSRPAHPSFDDGASPRSRPARPSFDDGPRSRPRDEEAAPRPRKSYDKPAPGMERYRVEVGTEHGVQVGNIVGAIANEAELDSQYIGPVKIHEKYSIVDLPEGMPNGLYKLLRKVWVAGKQLQISPVKETDSVRPTDTGAPKAHFSRSRPAGDFRPTSRPTRSKDAPSKPFKGKSRPDSKPRD